MSAEKDNSKCESGDCNEGDSSNSTRGVTIVTDTAKQHEESIPELTNKLTLDDLLVLFSWLPIKDLITVKRVCHSWREAARQKCLWKDYVLKLFSSSKDEINIKLMPDVQNIEGRASNSVLNVILENVIELSKLNVEFKPPLSTSQLMQVLEKYPKLESISLCPLEPNILETLEKLKTSQHLKKINFFSTHSVPPNAVPPNVAPYIINISKVFADCNNFPALTDFGLPYTADFVYAFQNHVSFRNLIADIIKKRSKKLLTFALLPGSAECSNVLNAISSCVKLQMLSICISPDNVGINIERMTELKSLGLFVMRADKTFSTSIYNSLEKGSWSHLTKVDISLRDKYNIPVLSAIIGNAKQLRMLHYMDRLQMISEHQLKDIGSLSKLRDLKVSCFKTISKQLIGNVSECHSLRSLRLYTKFTDICNKDSCITEMLLKLKYLECLLLNGVEYNPEVERFRISLENREDIKKYISETEFHR